MLFTKPIMLLLQMERWWKEANQLSGSTLRLWQNHFLPR